MSWILTYLENDILLSIFSQILSYIILVCSETKNEFWHWIWVKNWFFCKAVFTCVRTHHPPSAHVIRAQNLKNAHIMFYIFISVQMCRHPLSTFGVLHRHTLWINHWALLTCAHRSGWQIIPTRNITLIKLITK